MAIGIFKSLIFGDVDSADYGIYITGEAVYNAPQRAVEMVTVPGRNGAIALDQGRWENIEVSYPAGCFGGDQNDFASKISDFRNAIVSQIGYQRLTDEFNPNEYRMAVYASGLDVKPKSTGKAGEFTITFDCKPQRWLTSGEAEITVTSGQKLFNPTPYASSPLLAITGNGLVTINGYKIPLEAQPLGIIAVNELATVGATIKNVLPSGVKASYTVWSENANYNIGDEIIYGRVTVNAYCVLGNRTGSNPVTKVESLTSGVNLSYTLTADGGANYTIACRVSGGSIATGTSGTISTLSATIRITRSSGATDVAMTFTLSSSRANTLPRPISDGQKLDINLEFASGVGLDTVAFSYEPIYVNSSVPVLGNPTYIDCDLGETYRTNARGDYVSLNRYITLGSDLPELTSGENEITCDNTITELKIVPRWWIL